MEKFREIYPYISIDVYSKAICKAIFGNIGKGNETRNYDILALNNEDYRDEFVIQENDDKVLAYDVGVEMGFRFKTKARQFFMQCFVSGWIYSIGDYWREVDYGLSVDTLTFHAKKKKTDIMKDVVLN